MSKISVWPFCFGGIITSHHGSNLSSAGFVKNKNEPIICNSSYISEAIMQHLIIHDVEYIFNINNNALFAQLGYISCISINVSRIIYRIVLINYLYY